MTKIFIASLYSKFKPLSKVYFKLQWSELSYFPNVLYNKIILEKKRFKTF